MFVRLSLGRPRNANRDDSLELEGEMLSFYACQSGFAGGYLLNSRTYVGRLTFWESEATAGRAASSEHSLALRSQLLQRLTGEPIELVFEGTQFVGAVAPEGTRFVSAEAVPWYAD